MDDDEAVCARCRRTEPGPRLTWTLQADGQESTWLCDACTREHVRSIEGKLDERWW